MRSAERDKFGVGHPTKSLEKKRDLTKSRKSPGDTLKKRNKGTTTLEEGVNEVHKLENKERRQKKLGVEFVRHRLLDRGGRNVNQ